MRVKQSGLPGAKYYNWKGAAGEEGGQRPAGSRQEGKARLSQLPNPEATCQDL